jgi:hypothetical protein
MKLTYESHLGGLLASKIPESEVPAVNVIYGNLEGLPVLTQLFGGLAGMQSGERMATVDVILSKPEPLKTDDFAPLQYYHDYDLELTVYQKAGDEQTGLPTLQTELGRIGLSALADFFVALEAQPRQFFGCVIERAEWTGKGSGPTEIEVDKLMLRVVNTMVRGTIRLLEDAQ